jgi:hypothetical protein
MNAHERNSQAQKAGQFVWLCFWACSEAGVGAGRSKALVWPAEYSSEVEELGLCFRMCSQR